MSQVAWLSSWSLGGIRVFMKKTLKILAALFGVVIVMLGCVALVQAALAHTDIRGWFVNGGSEVIGDVHPITISARLWATFMCVFPLALLTGGALLCRIGFRRG